MWAEFKEKTYEILANIELVRGTTLIEPPDQSDEFYLGYDVAAQPVPGNVAWTAMQEQYRPGVQLNTGHWGGTTATQPDVEMLPDFATSCILQYKRPELMLTNQSWPSPGGPGHFYRFSLSSHQHRVLTLLENNLGDAALVRYTAPCFNTKQQMRQHRDAQQVMMTSIFVSPSSIGQNHRKVCYTAPQAPVYPNPEEGSFPGESLVDLFRMLRELGGRRRSLNDHLLKVTQGIFNTERDFFGKVRYEESRPWEKQDIEFDPVLPRAEDLPLTRLVGSRLALDAHRAAVYLEEIGACWKIFLR